MEYGLQLYSVRDGMAKDFEGTLKAVSEMGYKFVEFAGFFGKSAEEVKTILDKYNLKISGTHSPLKDLIENYDETVAFHKAIGNKNYIIPGHPVWSQKELDFFVENVNALIPKLAKDGITLGFHNHNREFERNFDGSFPYDQIVYRTDIALELDTYWSFVAMARSEDILDRYSDRIKFVHIKDGIGMQGKPLGQGGAPIRFYYEKVRKLGIPMVVESETITPNGLTEAKICIDFLKALEENF